MATIEHKGGNKWLLKVSDGIGIDGKRRRPTRIFEGTERQAKKAAILFEEEVKSGRHAELSNKFTLKEFTDLWLKDYGEKHLAPKTLARYKSMLDSRILPLIGHYRMDKVRPITINRWLNDLAVSPRLDGKGGTLSDQTIKHHFRCLSAIMQDAVEWDVIPSNPCSRVKAPQAKKKQIDCFNEEEVRKLLILLENETIKYKALIYLAIASGAREGEIMGLEWRHIDFRNNAITIKQSSQYLPGKGIFSKSPKNESSIRTISMPKNVIDILKAYRAEWAAVKLEVGDLWKGTERLFTTWDGQPGYPGWPGKWFYKFIRRHGLRPVPFHSLRHLSSTLLIKEGVPLKNVSKRLGHTVLGTTADIYTHTLESVDKQAARKIGKTLDLRKDKNKKRAK